jgi:hypothetical protein
MTYIEPNIRVFSTLEEAAKFLGDGGTTLSLFGVDKSVSLDDVARGTRNLIIGEPGIGKTLLLEKLEDLFRKQAARHATRPLEG